MFFDDDHDDGLLAKRPSGHELFREAIMLGKFDSYVQEDDTLAHKWVIGPAMETVMDIVSVRQFLMTMDITPTIGRQDMPLHDPAYSTEEHADNNYFTLSLTDTDMGKAQRGLAQLDEQPSYAEGMIEEAQAKKGEQLLKMAIKEDAGYAFRYDEENHSYHANFYDKIIFVERALESLEIPYVIEDEYDSFSVAIAPEDFETLKATLETSKGRSRDR